MESLGAADRDLIFHAIVRQGKQVPDLNRALLRGVIVDAALMGSRYASTFIRVLESGCKEDAGGQQHEPSSSQLSSLQNASGKTATGVTWMLACVFDVLDCPWSTCIIRVDMSFLCNFIVQELLRASSGCLFLLNPEMSFHLLSSWSNQ